MAIPFRVGTNLTEHPFHRLAKFCQQWRSSINIYLNFMGRETDEKGFPKLSAKALVEDEDAELQALEKPCG